MTGTTHAAKLPPTVSARRAPMTPVQLAFVRAWAEGLDVVLAHHRYLRSADAAVDARGARQELRRLLDGLGAVARGHGRNDLAALLRRDPEAMPDRRAAVIDLDTFRAQQPPDFYTEAELQALYAEHHGAPDSRSTARRRERLRARQLSALAWLEGLAVRHPQPHDAVTVWLDERVAARLAVVGIRRLDELQFWIRRKGFHWYRGIPKLGVRGAARVVAWLNGQATSLGRLPDAALQPAAHQAPGTLMPAPEQVHGIVPLERLAPASNLDGRRGSNRAPVGPCRLMAETDRDAVLAWLARFPEGGHTRRAYRKEAERFLLWALIARRKALSSLDAADCAAYRAFVMAPGPEWCGARNALRSGPDWRPFEAGLSARSATTALGIVRAMCAWLQRQGWLNRNPWESALASRFADAYFAAQAGSPRDVAAMRMFSPTQWFHLQTWLGAQPPSPARRRLALLLALGVEAGLRPSEIVAARLGDLTPSDRSDSHQQATLRVRGLRGHWRTVTLAPGVTEALAAHLGDRALEAGVAADAPTAPLVSRLDREAPLSAARLHDVLSSAFRTCAESLLAHDRPAAEAMRRASGHWLRHTHAVQSMERGVPLPTLQEALGHARLATTAGYAAAVQWGDSSLRSG